MKQLTISVTLMLLSLGAIAQGKTTIGVVPFKNSTSTRYHYNTKSKEITAIQDAVTQVFLATKRFSLVEREKMDQVRSEKQLQQNEDFIDGQVIEQSKSLGAQYIVTGNVSKAQEETSQMRAPIAGTITSRTAEVAFSIKVIDVTTGEIVATNSFTGNGRGKNSFEDALDKVKPDIERFIRENFKITGSIASVEEKNAAGDAVKVLLACGSSVGMQPGYAFKVYEAKELTVDGKKLTRKMTLGRIVVNRVEDENFSVCEVTEGGAAIAQKLAANAKVKCEMINEAGK
ncbi:MAG: hypothetical protein KF744_10770 [Taibaiella sp.]|nr:hypothetical protein [Taibaiella sp.]